MLVTIKEVRTVKLTRVAKVLADALEAMEAPLITDYNLFLLVRKIYQNPEGLYLRQPKLTIEGYRRTRNLLVQANKIARDDDYHAAFRILSKQDLSADEIACLVDPFCYISHMSAMQRYGLSNRRPESLHLTSPSNIKDRIRQEMVNDYGSDFDQLPDNEKYPLNIIHHPNAVRKRPLDIISTVNYGDHIQVRGSLARVSTIGQTFLDMLEEPQRCGGMAHVLEVWQEHAPKYLQEIILSVTKAPKPIHKVRAGYILDEVINIEKPEIKAWLAFAQRGGSRILDPSKPFASKFSEKWMLSLNV